MRINLSLALLFILFLGSCQPHQENIGERARKNQAAGKFWSALGNDLNKAMNCPSGDFINEMAFEHTLEPAEFRKFLVYVLNYSKNQLDDEEVLYRYPHYARDSIMADYHQLTSLGLLEMIPEAFKITRSGNELLDLYWQRKAATAAACSPGNEHVESLVAVGEKLLNEYAKMEAFKSLRLRIQNRPDAFDELPVTLKANELQRDLSAVFNDNGHYRIDYLLAAEQGKKWNGLELSPLAKELLGATRNNRTYPVQRCIAQPNWRVGENGCRMAISQLITAGLIEEMNDSIRQTPKGHALFQAADSLADKRLYSVWNALSEEEYEGFLKALDWLSER